jgi:hypothetical protein
MAKVLPSIFRLSYTAKKGLDIFSSKKISHGHEYKGYRIEKEGEFEGKIVSVNEAGITDSITYRSISQ